MKEIYQVADGYVIPSDQVEVTRINGRFVVRFGIQKYEHEAADEMQHDNEPPMMQCERIELKAIDYASVVSAIVRCRYSQSDIEAIVLNGSDTDEHASEYADLQSWRSEAKRIAKIVVGK
ncbi:MAG: hypothetical protein ACI4AI_06290 [Paludibacteraceae bacterium]